MRQDVINVLDGRIPNETKRAPTKVVDTGVPMERLATGILGELLRIGMGDWYIISCIRLVLLYKMDRQFSHA